MSDAWIYRLPRLAVVDVRGADAATIVHNVTTGEVRGLEPGQGHESFVTDVRGKTLGHVNVFRWADSIRLIGPFGQSQRIAQHLDRYTIREDATPTIVDESFTALVLSPSLAQRLVSDFATGFDPNSGESSLLRSVRLPIAGTSVDLYQCFWLGAGSALVLVELGQEDQVVREICERIDAVIGDESSFHHARVAARFPWYGIDLDESNLPQEADRDALAISFTKGCYLGQETVARLDALGQVQKKLVLWSIEGGVLPAGTTLQAGEKVVGRLTSVAETSAATAMALGFARRSHFEPGSVAKAILEPGSIEVTATVV